MGRLAKLWPLLLLLLTSCSSAQVTPSECRQVGVNVPDGAPMTGRIVEQNVADAAKVRAVCQSPFAEKRGCSLAVAPGEYVIWAIENQRVWAHERCHALYQVKSHT